MVEKNGFRKPWYMMLWSFFLSGLTFGISKEFSSKYSYFAFNQRGLTFLQRLKIVFAKYYEYLV